MYLGPGLLAVLVTFSRPSSLWPTPYGIGTPLCRFGFLKRFGFTPRWRAAGHARFGLGFGFLLGYRATGDGDDVVLYGGDRAFHTRPHPNGEALVNRLSYLLHVLYLVSLGDERSGRVQ